MASIMEEDIIVGISNLLVEVDHLWGCDLSHEFVHSTGWARIVPVSRLVH